VHGYPYIAAFVALSFLLLPIACRGPATAPAAGDAAASVMPEQKARRNSTLSTLYTIRGILELYKAEHADRYPAFERMVDWVALNRATDKEGNPGTGCGPYLTSKPCPNPFNDKSVVARAGCATPDTGWTYNEADGKFYVVLTAAQAQSAQLDADFVEILR
jgi:hypothetical protein